MKSSEKFPEIRVIRRGVFVDRVEWDPCRDGAPSFDFTAWRVTEIKRVVDPDGAPEVTVTFMARLVEIEEVSN